MKRVLLIVLLTCLAFVLHAQVITLDWAKQIGQTISYRSPAALAVDDSGNVYTTGSFYGTVDFDPGPGVHNLTSYADDIFICKLDSQGSFVWAKQMQNGPYGGGAGLAIVLDAPGNIYISGRFYSTVDFDPGPGVYNLTAGGPHGFICKLNTSGNLVWARQLLDGICQGECSSVAVDAAGNVFITGWVQGPGDFDPGPGVFLIGNSSALDDFIVKLDVSGNFVWARANQALLPNGRVVPGIPIPIALDAAGNIYVAGNFYGTVDFDPGPGVYILDGTLGNTFVWKLDPAGKLVWAGQMGMLGYYGGCAIVLDAAANVYITGSFGGTADFDPGPGTFNLNTIANGNSFIGNAFVAKLDASGNFVWARQMAGNGDASGYSVALDGAGNVYTAGAFKGTTDFDPGSGAYSLTAAGNGDVFISKLDGNGNFIWAVQMGGTGRAEAYALALDNLANVYTTGYFNGTADFDPGPGTYNLTNPGYDMFIQKLTPCIKKYGIINASTCGPYLLNGQIFDSTGIYTQTITSPSGCDSVITLNLTANKVGATINQAACKNYNWNGKVYTSTGTYTDTLVSTSGCDSVITLNLTITSSVTITIARSVCSGQSYLGHSTSGTYIDTIASSGCDTIRTLQLTVLPPPTPHLGRDTALCEGDSISLYPGPFNTYTWQDGSSQDHFVVMHPGLYAVTVNDGCGSSNDEIIVNPGICGIYFPSAFTPNNDGKNDLFRITNGYNLLEFHLTIFDRWGNKVFETLDPLKGWDGRTNGQSQSAASYIWYCSFIQRGNTSKTTRHGAVTLLR